MSYSIDRHDVASMIQQQGDTNCILLVQRKPNLLGDKRLSFHEEKTELLSHIRSALGIQSKIHLLAIFGIFTLIMSSSTFQIHILISYNIV